MQYTLDILFCAQNVNSIYVGNDSLESVSPRKDNLLHGNIIHSSKLQK